VGQEQKHTYLPLEVRHFPFYCSVGLVKCACVLVVKFILEMCVISRCIVLILSVSYRTDIVNCELFGSLTSLAVIPSVTRGGAKMQKTVSPRLTRSTDSETEGHAGVISVVMHWFCVYVCLLYVSDCLSDWLRPGVY